MKAAHQLGAMGVIWIAACASAPAQFLGVPTLPATLHVGDAAPEMKVAKWVKGRPVEKFEAGKVYVVEFWATWCVPCQHAMPHLTELAKTYDGKATFIGVDVWEHTKEKTDAAAEALVRPFVEKMGAEMGYTVAMDGADGAMGKHWITAAGHQWIPDTFVVDGQGKIAWIGMPSDLDEVLPKVIDGSWDIGAERKRVADEAAAFAAREAAYAPITAARKTKDPAKVLAACEEAVKASPQLATEASLVAPKLEALYALDGEKALAYVKELVAGKTVSRAVIVRATPEPGVATAMTSEQWKRLVEVVSPANGSSAGFLAAYSVLLERAGNREGAFQAEKQAIAATVAEHSEHAGKPVAPSEIPGMKAMESRLEALKTGGV